MSRSAKSPIDFRYCTSPLNASISFGLSIGIERRATRTVVEVHDLSGRTRAVGDELCSIERAFGDELRCIQLCLQERVDHFGVVLGVRLARDNAVEGRDVEFGTVVEELGLVLEHEQPWPRDELRQRSHLAGFQRGRTDPMAAD